MDDFFNIGIITKPQGIKGEVRVFPTTDDPKRFSLLKEVYVVPGDNPGKIYALTSAKAYKNIIIVKLDGIDDRNAAGALTGHLLKIPRSMGLPLEKDEYFVRDLLNLSVVTEEGEALGVLHDVLHTGANDVYVIKTPDKKEILIPAIRSVVLSVSLSEKKMTVRLMEGLRK